MGSPLCVSWDLASSAWSSLGCSVAATNTSRTVCECDHLGHFAVLMEHQTVPIVIHLPAFHVEIIVGAVISVFLLVTCLVLFKFREQVQKMLKIPCSKEEKKGLENCHKSQSFFNGINLMQAPGQEKSQTLSTSVADSQSRLSQYVLATGAGADGGERYENVHGDRYEDIQGQDPSSANQATLPMRARMSPLAATGTRTSRARTPALQTRRHCRCGPGCPPWRRQVRGHPGPGPQLCKPGD